MTMLIISLVWPCIFATDNLVVSCNKILSNIQIIRVCNILRLTVTVILFL